MAARGRGRGRGNQNEMVEMWRAIEGLTQAVEGLRQALQRQEPMGVPDGVRNREVRDLVEEEDLEDLEDVNCWINVDYENLFHEAGIADQAIGGGLEMDLLIEEELEPVYDEYEEEEDSDLFVCEGEQSDFVLDEGFVCEGEDSDILVCEVEQSDFVLDEGFVCEGEDSEFFIDGKRLENDVSKQDVCDLVWMDIGCVFDHPLNRKGKPYKNYFCKKNTKDALHMLAAKKIVKAGRFLGSNAKEKQSSVDPYIYRKYARTRWKKTTSELLVWMTTTQ